jgi:hypothetical protein
VSNVRAQAPSPDVVVVGAGFSKAAFETMPLTDELGNKAIGRARALHPDIGLPPVSFSPQYSFEALLSLLAEDQPHLTEPENRANAARFAALSEAVAQTLDEAQDRAFPGEAPAWLYELLAAWSVSRTTVITLNYDTVIETAIETMKIRTMRPSISAPKFMGGAVQDHVRAEDLLRDRPPVPWVVEGGRHAPVPAMRLLKLHGSIDWWWVPGDVSGMSLAREGTYGAIGAPQRLAEDLRDQHLPGRERFIIPPLATKSVYYRNPLTRQLWREAYEAISQAPRLTLIGYSLPTTDFVIAGMIRSGLAEREVRLEVVDKYPDDPIGRLKSLTTLDNARRIARYGEVGESSAPDLYAAERCDQLAQEVASSLALDPLEHGDDAAVFVHWPTQVGLITRRVFRATGPDGVGTVTVCTGTVDNLSEPDPTPDSGPHPTPKSLSRQLTDALRIVASDGADREGVVIAKGHGGGALALFPTGLFDAPANRQAYRRSG